MCESHMIIARHEKNRYDKQAPFLKVIIFGNDPVFIIVYHVLFLTYSYKFISQTLQYLYLDDGANVFFYVRVGTLKINCLVCWIWLCISRI